MKSMTDAYLDSLGGEEGQEPIGAALHCPSPKKPSGPTGQNAELGIVEDIAANMQSRPCVLCAEPYMGKSAVLASLISSVVGTGLRIRHVDCSHMLPNEATRALMDAAKWCNKLQQRGERTLVACDNLPSSDEADVYDQVGFCRRITNAGSMLVITLLPEAETFVEAYGEAVAYWSCDLRIPSPDVGDLADACARFGGGIPILMHTLERLEARDDETIMSHPSYQEAYAKVVESCVRPYMIEDERRLRCTLLLLGHGTLADVEEVFGRVDRDLWRTLGRDAPLFGVTSAKDTFSCVGSCVDEGLNVIFPMLQRTCEPWPELVYSASDFLARRGEYRRGAIASLMCSNVRLQCDVAFAWGAEFANAGEATVVGDALGCVEQDGGLASEGYLAAKVYMTAFAGDGPDCSRLESEVAVSDVSGQDRQVLHAKLAHACRALARGTGAETVPELSDAADGLSRSLADHHAFLTDLCSGSVEAAYERLLDSRGRVDGQTVLSAILTLDYVFCSLLIGIVPSKADMVDLARAGALFDRCGFGWLRELREMIVPLGCMLSGRRNAGVDMDGCVRLASRRSDNLLRGLFLMASGVRDLREGVYMRAHVRLSQAREAFACSDAHSLVRVARLIDIAIRTHLGEKVMQAEVLSCKGGGKALDKVVAVVARCLASSGDQGRGAGKARSAKLSRDVLWLVNVLSGDCGDFSVRFRDVMPGRWADAVVRASRDVDALLDGSRPDRRLLLGQGRGEPPAQPLQVRELRGDHIEVTMLGGFGVCVDGVTLKSSSLERRRAKALLALLAAVPEHAVKRFTAMESVWPEYDYEAANKCVYSATSVLRTEIGAIVRQKGFKSIVRSNKVEGTLTLDLGRVSCDVDAFERKAHKLLDSEGDDRVVVSLCREIEELYRGHLFVPSADGMGILEARSQQLRDLYADALVMGSVSAANLGMKMLACRFARKAHVADSMREDAVRLLIISLCAVGRYVEAQGCYDEYVAHMITVSRKPPSRRLREVVEKYVRHKAEDERGRARRAEESSLPNVNILDAEPAGAHGQMSLDFGMSA